MLTQCLAYLQLTYGSVAAVGPSNYDKDVTGVVISIESAWNPKATSKVGARGLMQVMPDTAKGVMKQGEEAGCVLPKGGYDLYDPVDNVQIGSCLLKLLHIKYEGDLIKVWLDYHGGPFAVRQYEKGWLSVNPTTRDYVGKASRLFINCGRNK